jgi:hypothetical protein
MKSKSRLITQEQAIKKLINDDIPKVMEEMAAYFEQEGNFHLANKLRANRHGVDYLSTDGLLILTPPDNITVIVEPGDEKYFLGLALVEEEEER